MDIRTRFAPSPTGFLHIGNLRTALFSYLIARANNGKFFLRIEDTDQKREVEGAVEKLMNIIEWIGLKFDEGAGIGGPHAPYIQSERSEIYAKYTNELLEKKGAYRCFCTPERLEAMRSEQQAAKQPPRYDRTCRNLSHEDAEAKIAAGEKFVIRQKMPLEGEVVVRDELHGEIKFKAADLDDQVLVKSNGVPTYHFAAMVDDHLMDTTFIVRGDEWISSLPKNVLLFRSFGWEPPKFIHPPLLLNKGGGKLSKRQGDVSVEDFRAHGYLPEAIINFCALLGWHPEGDNEIYSLAELEKIFDYTRIGTSPAVFDTDKLDYFNGYYIRHKSKQELAALCRPYLAENLAAATDPDKQRDEYIEQVVGLEQERLKKLSEIGELTGFFFVEQPLYEPELLVWKKTTPGQVRENLAKTQELLDKIPLENWTNDSIEEAMMTYIEAKSAQVGEFLWPLRAALTGRKASPSPFDVAEVLGKAETLKRLDYAVHLLGDLPQNVL